MQNTGRRKTNPVGTPGRLGRFYKSPTVRALGRYPHLYPSRESVFKLLERFGSRAFER
jgi:hypothetical protein